MHNPTLRIACALGALAFAGAAHAATALSGSVTQTATGGFADGNAQTLTQTDSWTGGAFRDLRAQVQPQGSSNGGLAGALADIEAHWDGANSGTIDYRAHAYESSGLNPGTPDEIFRLDTDETAPDWSYDFTATADGTFTFAFDLRSVASDAFALGGFDLEFGFGPPSHEFIRLHDFNPTSDNFAASGQVSRLLLAGQTYHVALISNDRLTVRNPVVGRNSNLFADFNWSISGQGVPEPSSWALSILGLGLSGAALRRRRLAVASIS
jgi:hypothetical protein